MGVSLEYEQGLGWLVFETTIGVQVLPINDIAAHSLHDLCPCHPRWEAGVLIHSSHDGRECTKH